MAYFNSNLIARRGYAGMSGVLDDILSGVKAGAGAVLDFYGKSEQTAGANAAIAQQNAVLTAALAQQQAQANRGILGGIDGTTLLIGGVAVAGAILLLRRK